jgi:hypothetical protein
MFTKKFWLDASERCIKTGAQVLLATLAVTNIFVLAHTTIIADLGAAGTAMVLSLLTSVASSAVGDKTSASLVSTTSG